MRHLGFLKLLLFRLTEGHHSNADVEILNLLQSDKYSLMKLMKLNCAAPCRDAVQDGSSPYCVLIERDHGVRLQSILPKKIRLNLHKVLNPHRVLKQEPTIPPPSGMEEIHLKT